MLLKTLQAEKAELVEKLKHNQQELVHSRVEYKVVKKKLYQVEDNLFVLKEEERQLKEQLAAIDFNIKNVL